jgi:uncharacterized protein with von Willebrand factor type A (vWA) domain
MLTVLIDFVHRLREAAIPVSMVETLDAVECLRHVDPTDRARFKATLAATLVKRAEHRTAFDALFDLHFAPRREDGGGHDAPPSAAPSTSPAAGEPASPPAGPSGELLEALLHALHRNDTDALRALAARAVSRFGGIDGERAGSARYYLYRVLRQLDLSAILQRAVREERERAGEQSAFDDRLLRDDQGRRLEEFRRLLAEAIQHRLAAAGGTGAAEAYRPGPIEDVDFLAASPAELREMRRAIRPLARKLAARIAHRRRVRRRGRLDVRRTIRRSLAAGGVPLDPAFRHPRVSRPDLYLLCDISGSVGEFAAFTLSLLYAMTEEFSRIRSFVFVDGIDEVTRLLGDRATVLDPSHLLARASVVWTDGHSDYGHVFRRFWQRCGRAGLGPKATVIITGDARNNYRDPGLEVFRAIADRARRVYWLNPEPRARWDTTDSVMASYAPYCDGVFEARNLRQLAEFARTIV